MRIAQSCQKIQAKYQEAMTAGSGEEESALDRMMRIRREVSQKNG